MQMCLTILYKRRMNEIIGIFKEMINTPPSLLHRLRDIGMILLVEQGSVAVMWLEKHVEVLYI